MNFKQIVTAASVFVTGLVLSSSPAQAAFTFTSNVSGTYDSAGKLDSTRDIFLNSVTLDNGQTVDQFALVKSAEILRNDVWNGGNSGAASSDRGDKASGSSKELATNASVVSSLGNRNLNNIIDTEDRGSFKMNLQFEQAVSSLFLWERGMNSDLSIQGLDSNGSLVGNILRLDRRTQKDARYSINTTEIGSAQKVGSWGVNLSDLGLTGSFFGVQVSADASHNGADFKLMGGSAEAAPEPFTIGGTLVGLALGYRLKKKQQSKVAA